jgi:hypothetical protein
MFETEAIESSQIAVGCVATFRIASASAGFALAAASTLAT